MAKQSNHQAAKRFGQAERLRKRSRGASRRRVFSPLELLEARQLLSVVTNTSDAGAGSLRQAILDADNSHVATSITFSLPAGSTIAPTSPLPAVTVPVTFTAPTQGGPPVISLDGSLGGAGAIGLQLTAARSSVVGLDIIGFAGAGVLLGAGGGDTLGNDYIGVDLSGTTARGNGIGVEMLNSSNNLVSGSVISGNHSDGIRIVGGSGNVVRGNLIGTDWTGAQPLGNAQLDPNASGVTVDGASGTTIGGTTAADRNIISANAQDGVTLQNVSDAGTVVEGNYIGLDLAGQSPIPNGANGINLGSYNAYPTSSVSVVNNTISGNLASGVYLSDGASNITIQGNLIGTDAAGQLTGFDPAGNPLTGNQANGITVDLNSGDNLIGGPLWGEGNIISANWGNGINVNSGPAAAVNTIQGNTIGLDGADSAAVPNEGNGITVVQGATLIGGTAAGDGNFISANFGNGLSLADDAVVQGNFIGIGAGGQAGLGNLGDGVFINGSDNLVGGPEAGAGNVIANSGTSGGPADGIQVLNGTGNTLRGNSVFANTGLGIDLGADGVTLNDAQGHVGPNNYQNFPVIDSVVNSGGNVTITGTLSSTAAGPFAIDFYADDVADPTGYGQGKTYLGSVTVSTGGSTFSATFHNVPSDQTHFSATATDSAGNTSEFALTIDQTIAQAYISSTSLSSSDNPSVFGEPVTLTAHVSGNQQAPTGSVTFTDGTTILATVTLDNSGNASFQLTNARTGSHPISATYSGDGLYPASGATLTQAVNPASTATSLSASSGSTTLGARVTFTATVNPIAPGAGTPTGAVTFSDGTTVLATVPINGNTAVFSTSALSLGGHSVVATYNGDANFQVSNSTPVNVQVNAAPASMTALSSSTNPSVYGQQILLTSAVTGNGATPTGSVTFFDGPMNLGTVPLDAHGNATWSLSSMTTGSHALSAVYSGDATYPSSSGFLAQVVAKASSTTTISESASSVFFGQAASFTATVNAVAPGAGTLTGSITFSDGGTVLAVLPVFGGSATYTTGALALGSHTITATYGGDTNFNASSAAPMAVQVNPAPASSTALTSSVDPSVFGQMVTFTALISGNYATPTGLVQFMDGQTMLGAVNVDGSGNASISLSTLSTASHTITAVYGGDAAYPGSNATLVQVVNPASTGATLSGSASSATFGQPVSFTAVVNPLPPGAGAPTGSITFSDQGTVLAVVPLTGNSATYTSANWPVGAHSVTATYGGDANFTPSSAGPDALQINAAPASSTALNSSVNPSVYGQPVTFTATVVGNYGTPTGSVTFLDGSLTLATVPLDGVGRASFTPASLGTASHAITAVYNGDLEYPMSSGSMTQVVAAASTTTSLGASAVSTTFGQSVTFTATVAPVTPGNGLLTGSVTFSDAGAVLAVVPLSGNSASFSDSALAAGGHLITATYSGDINFSSSASAPVNLTVKPVAGDMTTLQSSVNPAVFGQSVTFVATVAGNLATPSGVVKFMDGPASLGSVALDASGQASLTLCSLEIGGHSITAVYGGDSDYPTSSASLAEVVKQASTTTSLGVSASSTFAGQPVTLTANVSVVMPGAGSLTGSITFSDGNTLLAIVPLIGSSASFTTASLSLGSHSITATYSGDTHFKTSSDGPAPVMVKALPASSTALSTSANPSVYGQSVMLTATVTGNYALPTGTVTFMDGQAPLGTVALDGSGTASLSLAELSTSSHSIVAVYNGDSEYPASQASLTQVVNKAATTTGLTESASSDFLGASVTFSATVNAITPGAGILTGSITFSEGSIVLATVALSGNSASFTTSSLAIGGHSIVATYSGDTNFTSSNAGVAFVVDADPASATSLGSSVNPAVYGQPLTLTASVSGNYAAPTGSVTFTDGQTVLGTVAIDASGKATLALSALEIGAHAMTATYSGDSVYPGSSDSISEVVNKASTATTLGENVSTSTIGHSVTFSAWVNPVAPGAGTPGGSITFADGSTVLAVAPISGGSASFTTTAFSVGAHKITATYNGDAHFSSSSAGPVVLRVNPAPVSATTLASDNNPSVSGQAILLTATVTGNYNTPTGIVTFMDGQTNLGAVTLDATGKASLSVKSLTTSSHSITAIYSGDSTYPTSSGSLAQVVNKASTTTALSASAATLYLGQSETFTATLSIVSPGAGSPTGSMTFFDGSAVLAVVPLTGNSASFSTTGLSLGGHRVTAVYSGDTNFNLSASSPSAVTITAAPADTELLSSSANPSVSGQAITFTATLSGNYAAPTGAVTFMDGQSVLATKPLVNGSASLTVSNLATGAHAVKAVYSGDAEYAANSSALSQVVNQASTTTALSASSSSVTFGQSETFTATLAIVAPGAGAATGYIAFSEGSTVLAVVPLNGNTAVWTTTGLSVGSHSITAAYGGDVNFAASASAPATVFVKPASNSISGHTYFDTTGNGLSSDDPVMGNVTVNLYLDRNGDGQLTSADGTPVATTVSDGKLGTYSFNNLPAGTYFVQEVTPTGYVQTAPTTGSYYTVKLSSSGGSYPNEDFDNFRTCHCVDDLSSYYFLIDGCKKVTDLRGNVHQGDTVQVKFTVKPGSDVDLFSLVSYTAPGATFVASAASKQAIYDDASGVFGAGNWSLTVVVPPCYFQVDFVCGAAINQFGPAGSNIFYSAEGRLISADNGGINAAASNLQPIN